MRLLQLLIIGCIMAELLWAQPPEDGVMLAFDPFTIAFALAAFSATTGIYSSYVQRQASRQQAALAQQQADMNRQAASLPSRERGLKRSDGRADDTALPSLPSRERGLKLPARGPNTARGRRSLHGSAD